MRLYILELGKLNDLSEGDDNDRIISEKLEADIEAHEGDNVSDIRSPSIPC